MTFFIESSNLTGIAISLNLQAIEYDKQNTDIVISEWIIAQIKDNNKISQLVIPMRLGRDDIDYMGLYIGMHIRLTQYLGNKRFIPLIFVSNETREEILESQIRRKSDKTAMLLFTKGCSHVTYQDLIDFDKIEIPSSITDENEFIKEVLPHIEVKLPERYGNHEIGNIWGAYRLTQCMKTSFDTTLPQDLYFKFKQSHFEYVVPIPPSQFVGMTSLLDYKILLIDDKAAKGWENCIKKMFIKKLNSSSIGKLSIEIKESYEEAKQISNFSDYDLIFLDLRLKINEDKGEFLETEGLSGTEILKDIKDKNKGTQVIILTASSKAWNMKTLFQLGADGYYIKESPEYNFSIELSRKKYQELDKDIDYCINRRYLRDLFMRYDILINKINSPNIITSYSSGFLETMKNQLEISLDMHQKAKEPKEHAFAFLMLHIILEEFTKEFIEKTTKSDQHGNNKDSWCFKGSNDEINEFKWNQPNYDNIGIFSKAPATWQKIASIYFESWKLQDYTFIRKVYYLIKDRNEFVHNEVAPPFKIENPNRYKNLFDIVEKLIGYL